MKLLDEIIDVLMRNDGSLNEALLRTKVLLHKIGQKELVGWVNSELTGYGMEDALPEYRDVRGSVYGDISNGFYTHKNRPVPVMHLGEVQRSFVEGGGLRQALDVLEQSVASAEGKGSSWAMHLPPEVNSMLSEALTDGYYVDRAWRRIETSQMRQVLIVVRSRLLDFVIKLQEQIGPNVSEDEVKEVAASIDVTGLLAGAVIGDNATFVLGNHNSSQVRNTNIKGDRNALAAELKENGVSDADIAALNSALDDDPRPVISGQYGPAVKAWMKGMFDKAVDASWNIELGIAGGLLTTAIQHYYGL